MCIYTYVVTTMFLLTTDVCPSVSLAVNCIFMVLNSPFNNEFPCEYILLAFMVVALVPSAKSQVYEFAPVEVLVNVNS